MNPTARGLFKYAEGKLLSQSVNISMAADPFVGYGIFFLHPDPHTTQICSYVRTCTMYSIYIVFSSAVKFDTFEIPTFHN